jgi:hypothetical protein
MCRIVSVGRSAIPSRIYGLGSYRSGKRPLGDVGPATEPPRVCGDQAPLDPGAVHPEACLQPPVGSGQHRNSTAADEDRAETRNDDQAEATEDPLLTPIVAGVGTRE